MNGDLNIPSVPILEARYSSQKAWRLLILCLVCMAIFAVFAFMPIHWVKIEGRNLGRMLSGLLIVGTCVVVLLRRILMSGSPVLIITSEGILDRRVAARIIPWKMIRGVSNWDQKSRNGKTVEKYVVLDVDKTDERQLSPTVYTRLTRGLNWMMGANGLTIKPGSLDVGYDQVFTAITAHVEASRKESRPLAHVPSV